SDLPADPGRFPGGQSVVPEVSTGGRRRGAAAAAPVLNTEGSGGTVPVGDSAPTHMTTRGSGQLRLAEHRRVAGRKVTQELIQLTTGDRRGHGAQDRTRVLLGGQGAGAGFFGHAPVELLHPERLGLRLIPRTEAFVQRFRDLCGQVFGGGGGQPRGQDRKHRPGDLLGLVLVLVFPHFTDLGQELVVAHCVPPFASYECPSKAVLPGRSRLNGSGGARLREHMGMVPRGWPRKACGGRWRRPPGTWRGRPPGAWHRKSTGTPARRCSCAASCPGKGCAIGSIFPWKACPAGVRT